MKLQNIVAPFSSEEKGFRIEVFRKDLLNFNFIQHMNNKIVSVVLIAGIAATGFAGISAANETSTGSFFK